MAENKAISILKTSIFKLLGIQPKSQQSKPHDFADLVSPMKASLYEEIRHVAEMMHDIMLKTAKFVKVNDNLLPLTGISYDDLEMLSGTPNHPLLCMSGHLRLSMDRYGQLKVLDFRPGGLVKCLEVAKTNNDYCFKKHLRPSIVSPEVLLQNWLIFVISGYRQLLPLRKCALLTNNQVEYKLIASICKKVGLEVVCTGLNQVKFVDDAMYYGKHKIDIIIRTTPFHEIINDRAALHNILDAMHNHNLIMLNPVEEFIANSRSLQAIAWHLYETGKFYTEKEHQFIGEYMLPTYIVPKIDGPTWLMQFYEEEEIKFEGFDQIPTELMEEDGIIYQYRGSDQHVQLLEAYLIGNQFAGCIYMNPDNKYEYTFVKRQEHR